MMQMQPVQQPLFIIHRDASFQASLRRVVGPQVRVLPGWSSLKEALRRAPATTVACVDPFEEEGGNRVLAPGLHSVLRALPSAAIVAAFRVGIDDGLAVATLMQWGIADVIDTEREHTTAALTRRFQVLRERAAHRLLERALPATFPSRPRALLIFAAETMVGGGQERELALRLGVTPRTVSRWCGRVGLPPPKRLMGWLRLLRAADLLDDPGRSIASVARVCGYAVDGTLRSALRSFVGDGPGTLRAEGGAFSRVAQAFTRELFEKREDVRSARQPGAVWLN